MSPINLERRPQVQRAGRWVGINQRPDQSLALVAAIVGGIVFSVWWLLHKQTE